MGRALHRQHTPETPLGFSRCRRYTEHTISFSAAAPGGARVQQSGKYEKPMSDDESERRILSHKELAREQRRAAYQKAKERRANDPRYLAMKEAAKEQRRAAYQQLKERRKAEALEEKRKAGARRDPNAERKKKLAAKYGKHLEKDGKPLTVAPPSPLAPRAQKAMDELAGWLTKGSDALN